MPKNPNIQNPIIHNQSIQNNPIGIFDSGVGGLSVLKEIGTLLPNESIHYFADSGNCPYGSKEINETLTLSKKNIQFLLDLGCKLIVVACNTVTAIAIDTFRKEFDVPFVGMEPALKPASLKTRTKKIGILATENTFNGRLFKRTYDKYARDIEVFVQPGYGLVELVENGDHNSERALDLLEKYLCPMLASGVDTLVLGCTHYPFLTDTIAKITGSKINIIDPANAVAAQTKRMLKELGLNCADGNSPCVTFYTTGEKPAAQKFLYSSLDREFQIKTVARVIT